MCKCKNIKRSIIIALILLAVCGLIGCATILAGSTQNITIDSNVPGAVVRMNGNIVGNTPFHGIVKKSRDDIIIIVSAEGFNQVSTNLSSEIEPLFFVNFLTGGTFGTTTDASSGAMWRYRPNSFYANLIPVAHTTNCHDYHDELLIRYFSMVNHSQIAIDSSEPTGEYFNTIVSLLERNMDNEEATVSVRESLKNSKGDQITFGNELIGRFRTSNE